MAHHCWVLNRDGLATVPYEGKTPQNVLCNPRCHQDPLIGVKVCEDTKLFRQPMTSHGYNCAM
jgi:hypothetical protein